MGYNTKMDLTSTKTIKDTLNRYDVKPSKGLGQNFLVNKSTLNKITATSDLDSEDTVLEIGPGLGTLTVELAKKAKRVIAVEKDKKMCEILKNTFKCCKNVQVINNDILKTNIDLPKGYKVVANIPYYLTSQLIRKLLESENQPQEIILMIQKEVAQRICADAPDMSLLSVSVQFYAKAKIVSYIKKENFWPKPKVDSAIIKITPTKETSISVSPDLFFKIVKAGFSQPRKQISNNLSKGLKLDKEIINSWLLKNNIRPTQRAETLGIESWVKLATNWQ